MTNKIEEIAREIKQMTPDQLKAFRAWYEEFDSNACDKQIEENAEGSKLDDLASKALLDHRAGKTKKL